MRTRFPRDRGSVGRAGWPDTSIPDGEWRWPRRRSRLGRLLLLLPAYLGLISIIAVSTQLIRYTIRFPDPRALRIHEPAPSLRILARDGSVIAERGERNDFIALDRLPRHLVDAVIAIEDRRFHSHWGLDPSGLLRAAYANLRAGRTSQGGSTLTQQLAKNLFLSTDRTLTRKLEEAMLAVWLELRLSKKDILELYLNRVYFGGGAYGVEAAAQRYFNKSARTVNLAEAAVIAGLLKAPSKFSPFANPGLARARSRVVLGAMLTARLISPASVAASTSQAVKFADPQAGRKPNGLEYALDYALDQMPPLASVGRREVIVETTLDADLQRHAQSAVETALARNGQAAKVDQAAIVVLDTSGGIRALVGGRSFAESQFNRAVKARRQPGSAFKPLVYLTAVEGGLWPDSPVSDAPIEIGQWSPRNDDGRYRGPITLTQALAHSVNTVAVRLQQKFGAEKIASVAHRLGIRSRLHAGPSLALGTSEVGLLELATAYGTLASGGLAVEPFVIRRMLTSDGEVLFERRDPRPRMLVAPDTIGAMNTMLNAAIVSGTGRHAAFPRHQAAGKTGTTQDFRDAWFMGYTAHLIAGVWFGNNDGTPMNRVTGGSLPALVWRDVMSSAHEHLAPRALPAMDAGSLDPTRAPEPGVPRSVSPAIATSEMPRIALDPGAGGDRKMKRAPKEMLRPPMAHVSGPRMPAQPIDPEFIARALALGSDNSPDGGRQRSGTTASRGLPEARSRIVFSRRPASEPVPRMGLGSGQ